MKDHYEKQFDGKVRFWTGAMEIEYSALNQIRNIANLPILGSHIAIMPDVHMGMGATVGSVIPLRGAVIPSAVGVDIGCGMCAVQLTLKASDLPDSLREIREAIEAAVPVGFNYHSPSKNHLTNRILPQKTVNKAKSLLESFDKLRIFQKIKGFDAKRMMLQMGTLGGGNHFIELCLDENQNVWVMLHSGSRNVGKTVGEAATYRAKQAAIKENVNLPDKDLAWFAEGSEDFEEYIEAMLWCQDYAALNREIMMALTLGVLQKEIPKKFDLAAEIINCHHNFANKEVHNDEPVWVTRKGAVSAQAGQMGIIPGSMGAKSFIVRGKGNTDSFCSCSHGAGRVLSRTKAKEQFSLDDLAAQTAGVECRKDEGVLDEIPGAYKDIDLVMAAQDELVEIVHTLKQVMCIKG